MLKGETKTKTKFGSSRLIYANHILRFEFLILVANVLTTVCSFPDSTLTTLLLQPTRSACMADSARIVLDSSSSQESNENLGAWRLKNIKWSTCPKRNSASTYVFHSSTTTFVSSILYFGDLLMLLHMAIVHLLSLLYNSPL